MLFKELPHMTCKEILQLQTTVHYMTLSKVYNMQELQLNIRCLQNKNSTWYPVYQKTFIEIHNFI